ASRCGSWRRRRRLGTARNTRSLLEKSIFGCKGRISPARVNFDKRSARRRYGAPMKIALRRLTLCSIAVLALSAPTRRAFAYYLAGDAHRFDLRLRAYSQLGILTNSSETPSQSDVRRALSYVPADSPAQRRAIVSSITPPTYGSGDLAQHRNFYNPEFDANL